MHYNIQTIFITGTSSGLGKQTALYFAQQGWNVIATMRNPEREEELNQYKNIIIVKLDITSIIQIQEAIEYGIQRFRKIDVVVNNAGVGLYSALELATETDIDWQLATNVRGPINVIRAFLPHFRNNKGGRFINISSIMGLGAVMPLGSVYSTSKFALEGLIEGLYYELKPLNIKLHLLEPGGFKSAFNDNLIFNENNKNKDYGFLASKVAEILSASYDSPLRTNPQKIVATIYALATGRKKAFRTIIGKDAKILFVLRKILPIKLFLFIVGKRFCIKA